jgi:hypothetical protein
MHTRLEGLSISMFGDRPMLIYSTHDLEPPKSFKEVWHLAGQSSPGQEVEDLLGASFVLLFPDVEDHRHLQKSLDISLMIASLGEQAPLVILLPHSSGDPQQQSEKTNTLADTQYHALTSALKHGTIDEVVCGQPRGVKLVCEIRSRMKRSERLVAMSNRVLEQHRDAVEKVDNLKDFLYDALWRYCRYRMRIGVPDIDPNIKPGHPESVGGMIVGAKLGEGSCGVVCKLRDPAAGADQVSEVLKIVEKATMTSFRGIASLKRQIQIMQSLSDPNQHEHPNLTKLYEVYHSETHVLFRMEYAGAQDLFKRLYSRETTDNTLGVTKASDIINQCSSAVCHLHWHAQVAHGDLKPENMIISETPENLVVKITDFDSAYPVRPGSRVRGMTGTFPFMAPETATMQRYDARAADVWSLAVVFLEVLCHLKILSRVCSLTQPRNQEEQRAALVCIHGCFARSSFLTSFLAQKIRPELHSLLDDSHTFLEGMLDPDAEQRWTAQQLDAAVKQSNVSQLGEEE